VTLRAYWLPPWENRHYFPFHSGKPRRAAAAGPPKPAEPYFRRWSNSGAFIGNASPDLPPTGPPPAYGPLFGVPVPVSIPQAHPIHIK
jgi:hypothetical protein